MGHPDPHTLVTNNISIAPGCQSSVLEGIVVPDATPLLPSLAWGGPSSLPDTESRGSGLRASRVTWPTELYPQPLIELKLQCLLGLLTHWVPPASLSDDAKQGAFKAILP